MVAAQELIYTSAKVTGASLCTVQPAKLQQWAEELIKWMQDGELRVQVTAWPLAEAAAAQQAIEARETAGKVILLAG